MAREGDLNRTISRFELPDLGDQGVATRDDIDKTLRLGMNHPMGPLQLGASSSLLLAFPFNPLSVQLTCTIPFGTLFASLTRAIS